MEIFSLLKTRNMTLYLVNMAKWNGKGSHKQKSIGVTEQFELAQKLMVEKVLHMTEREKQRDGNVLRYHNKFDDIERELYLGDLDDAREVLDNLTAAGLASDTEIRIPRAERGLCVKIKDITFYDKSTIDMAPTIWEMKWKEELNRKLQWVQDRLL